MKRAYLMISVLVFFVGNSIAQNLNTSNGGYETKRIINGKKFQVLYDEVAIDKTVDEVWNEVALNFVNIDRISTAINFTRCLSGDTISGLGTKRLCNLDFQGQTVEIKEEIIDFKECGDYREFTYDVYDAPDIPLKNYATWVVRKGDDGKTYLGSAFIFRANIGFLSGAAAKKLKKSGNLRTGVLGYKHYLETGEMNVDSEKLIELYPAK